MDSRKVTGPVTAPPLNYEDFDPDYDQVQEPQVDTLLIYLPGFRKDQIRVQLTTTGILKISGQRPLEGNKWQRFLKQFQISSNCDTNRISAKFESGTLYITQPKLIIPAEKPEPQSLPHKPADATGEKTTSDSDTTKSENASDSDTTKSDNVSDSDPKKPENVSHRDPTKPANVSDRDPAKPENVSDKKGVGAASRTEAGEQTRVDDASDKKAASDDKRAVDGKSDGEKSGAGKAAKMDCCGGGNAEAAAAQLKRSRKMMNVALVVLLVVGVGLYLNSKMRSSSNDVGEL